MKPVMFCRNTSGTLRWLHSSMKCAPFSALGEQDAVVGDDADRIAVDVREAGDERPAVARLEFLELRAVDDARDDFADVEGLARVGRHAAVEFRCRVQRLARGLQRERDVLLAVEMGDDVARDVERMRIVLGEVVGDAGNGRMDVRAAQRFRVDDFAGRGLHQRRAAEEDRALFLDDDGLVAHRRHVGAAGRA
jgi:hypothetical protein